MEGVLQIKGLVCGYKVQVVRADDFEFLPGTCSGIFGDNGSGKSTLLRTLAGLQKPISGRVLSGGQVLSGLSDGEGAKYLSFLTSLSPAPSGLTGRQIVAMGRLVHTGLFAGLSAEDEAITERALEQTATLHLAEKRMSEMSDGERKRVMIAQCLAQDTRVILLDEPFGFLDARAKNAIHHLLVRVAEEQKKIIILTTHEIGISPPLLHRCLLIDEGNMRESSTEGIARHFG